MNEIDVDEIDAALCSIVELLDEIGISRTQQHLVVRERISVAQDAVDAVYDEGGIEWLMLESSTATKH